MSAFDFDTRALVVGAVAQATGTATAVASYSLINTALVPGWALAIVDSGRLISGGFDTQGNVVTPKITAATGVFSSLTIGTITDTAAAKYAWSVSDNGRLLAAYIDLSGTAFFGAGSFKSLTVNGVAITGSTTTPPGNPVTTSIWNPDAIRQWRKIANDMRLRGGWGHVAIVADSQYPCLSFNEYVVTASCGGVGPVLTRLLRDRFGDGGPGFCPMQASQGFNSNDQVGAIPAEAIVNVSGSWSDVGLVGWAPNQRAGTTSTVGDTATFTYSGGGNLSAIDLHHGGGGGTISYAYNGGAATQVTLPSAPGKLAMPAPPAGNHTLVIKLASGTMPLAGFFARKATGVCVSNLAICGTLAQGWASVDQTAWAAAIGRLAPHAVVFNLAGNDELASRTVAQYTADMTTLITSVRTGAGIATDVILSYRWASDRAGAVPQAVTAYATAMKGLCVGLRAALYDAQYRSGATFAEYTGSAATILAMTQDDKVHASLYGRDTLAAGPAEILGAASPYL